MKTQVFCFGASFVYGVGGTEGGWADMLKRHIHRKQYGAEFKEVAQFYNFSKPGMFVREIVDCIDSDIAHRKIQGTDSVVIISSGMNDAKSRDISDNYVNSPEQFKIEFDALMVKAQSHTNKILYVSGMFVDEIRTMPKLNADGPNSYFSNERITIFNKVAMDVCAQKNIQTVNFFSQMNATDWSSYLCADGLHPNDTSYQYMFDQINPEFEKMISL